MKMVKTKNQISLILIITFPEPKNMEQGNFLQRLSDALEESELIKLLQNVKLPVG